MTTEPKPSVTAHAFVEISHAADSLIDGGGHGGRGQPEAIQEARRTATVGKAGRRQSARFGRTKSERMRWTSAASRASDLLDQHRIDGEDAS